MDGPVVEGIACVVDVLLESVTGLVRLGHNSVLVVGFRVLWVYESRLVALPASVMER